MPSIKEQLEQGQQLHDSLQLLGAAINRCRPELKGYKPGQSQPGGLDIFPWRLTWESGSSLRSRQPKGCPWKCGTTSIQTIHHESGFTWWWFKSFIMTSMMNDSNYHIGPRVEYHIFENKRIQIPLTKVTQSKQTRAWNNFRGFI